MPRGIGLKFEAGLPMCILMALSILSSASYSPVYGATVASGAAPAAMTAAAALRALSNHTARTVAIVDSVANIQKNLDALVKHSSAISSLGASDGTALKMTATQLQAGANLASRWSATAGNTLEISSASAAQALAITSDGRFSAVNRIHVTDTSINVQRNIDALNAIAGTSGRLASIRQIGTTAPITLTAGQFSADGNALAKIENGAYALSITGASVDQTLGYAGNARIRAVAIRATSSAIAANLDGLQAMGLQVKSITATDSNAMRVQASQVKDDALALGKVISGYQLRVLGANAAQMASLSRNTKVLSVDLVDSAANLSGNWTLLNRLGNHVASVTVTDPSTAIGLSANQFLASTTLLSRFDTTPGAWSLALTGAAAGDAVELASSSTHIASIAITDGGAQVSANLDDLQSLLDQGRLANIALAGGGTELSLTQSDLTQHAALLGKIAGNAYGLSVAGLSVSQAQDLLATNPHAHRVTVSDTAAHIAGNLDALTGMGRRLVSIVQRDGDSALDMTMQAWIAHRGVLGKIQGGYTTTLTAVSADQAVPMANDSHVVGMAISDTAARLSARWDAIRSVQNLVTGLSVSDASTLQLSASRYLTGQREGLLAHLDASTTIAVTGASVSQAQTIAANNAVTHIAVEDTGTNIANHLADLATLQAGGKLTGIRQLAVVAPFTMSYANLASRQAVLDLINGGNYTLTITDIGAGDAATLAAANRRVTSLMVSDDSSGIASNLGALASLGKKLGTIEQTDRGTALQLSESTFIGNAATLDRISGGYLADVSGVSAGHAATIASNAHVASLQVTDSGAHLSANWDTLANIGAKLSGAAVTQSDTSALSLTANQVLGEAGLLDNLATPYTINVSNATASQAATISTGDQSSAVHSIAVSDTAAGVGGQLDALRQNTLVDAIQITDASTGAPLQIDAAQLDDYTALLQKINGGHYPLAINQAFAADAATLAANPDVTRLSVADSSGEIGTHFNALAGISTLRTLTLTDAGGTVALSQQQVLDHAALLGKISNDHSISVSGVTMDYLQTFAANDQVSSMAIADSSANVSAGFDELAALGSTVSSITLDDSSVPLALTAAQWQSGSTVLGTLGAGSSLTLSDVLAADAQAAAADPLVATMAISDTADGIAGSWDSLVALYGTNPDKLASITASDNNPITLSTDQITAGASMIASLLPDAIIQST
jgi:hypothetical protein